MVESDNPMDQKLESAGLVVGAIFNIPYRAITIKVERIDVGTENVFVTYSIAERDLSARNIPRSVEGKKILVGKIKRLD